jgi:cobalamin biosynthesis Mg chelatase CobN
MADPRSDRPIVETTTEAREGSTPGVTRYVVIFGLALVVIIFAVIVWVGRS